MQSARLDGSVLCSQIHIDIIIITVYFFESSLYISFSLYCKLHIHTSTYIRVLVRVCTTLHVSNLAYSSSNSRTKEKNLSQMLCKFCIFEEVKSICITACCTLVKLSGLFYFHIEYSRDGSCHTRMASTSH